ncbi:RNA polymerase subunit sigma-70 [Kitasatospora paranensis]|uniref:RNA polymerase subunit sigma-70 n=1 Tax=Kitasatospora paranensis TaxID=258053 RepID=A0ABW2G343_9ACTN
MIATMATGEDFATRTEPVRRELLAYCYRMLGSVHDAEDLLQETWLRAWRAWDGYDPARASVRTWLYRIATNVCLSALEQRARRPLPSGLGAGPDGDPDAPLVRGEGVPWLQPFPHPEGEPGAADGLRLALVAALQYLPARQRAVLVLREVLDWPVAEAARALEMTPAAVNSALQRARARLAATGLREDEVREPAGREERALLDRYVAAFRNADLETLRTLLAEDVVLEMPPFLNWYVGPDDYVGFLQRAFRLRGTDWRMVPIGANGQPAVAAYLCGPDGVHRMHTIQVFTVARGMITRTTVFQDQELFAAFGLAPVLADEARPLPG